MTIIKEEYKLKKEGNLWVTTILDNRYGFRKWTWGEKNDVSAKATNLNPLSGALSYDSAYFNNQLLLKTVRKEVDGKFIEFSEEEIKNLDGQLGERLFQITQRLNLVLNVEAQNL